MWEGGANNKRDEKTGFRKIQICRIFGVLQDTFPPTAPYRVTYFVGYLIVIGGGFFREGDGGESEKEDREKEREKEGRKRQRKRERERNKEMERKKIPAILLFVSLAR